MVYDVIEQLSSKHACEIAGFFLKRCDNIWIHVARLTVFAHFTGESTTSEATANEDNAEETYCYYNVSSAKFQENTLQQLADGVMAELKQSYVAISFETETEVTAIIVYSADGVPLNAFMAGKRTPLNIQAGEPTLTLLPELSTGQTIDIYIGMDRDLSADDFTTIAVGYSC